MLEQEELLAHSKLFLIYQYGTLAFLLGLTTYLMCSGYMSPEYAIDGKFSAKSDIFSFGVVLLEIISGKKNRGFDHSNHNHTLLGHVIFLPRPIPSRNDILNIRANFFELWQAWLLWREKRIVEVMDEYLRDSYVEAQVKRCIQVGLLCVQKFAEDRPVMGSVLFMLGSEGAILPEPKEPGFFHERSYSVCKKTPCLEEQQTFTITDLEGR